MQIGMIGLGKMGKNMTRRLMHGGHSCVVYDLNPENVKELAGEGADGSASIQDFILKLTAPRVVWVMVPAGDPTEKTIGELECDMEPGDIIIDGGNSYYKDDIRRSESMKKKGLHYVDAGTSGGVWGLSEDYSLMVGGDAQPVDRCRPIFETLAPGPDKGWGHVGPPGAGHFVKMIHNGIEYGMMQSYAEGFELMEHKSEFKLNLQQVSQIWRYGSVVRSWLLDLIANALEDNPELKGIAAYVPDSGEGRWTVAEAIELNCSIPVITLALERRFRSREESPFGDKLIAAMRQQFGGHAVKGEKE